MPADVVFIQPPFLSPELKVPQLTTAQRDALVNPIEGTLIENITTHKLNVRTLSAWEIVVSA